MCFYQKSIRDVTADGLTDYEFFKMWVNALGKLG